MITVVHKPPRREAGTWKGRLMEFYVHEGFSPEEAERLAYGDISKALGRLERAENSEHGVPLPTGKAALFRHPMKQRNKLSQARSSPGWQ